MNSGEPLPSRPTCTVAQAAAALGVSVGLVYKMLKQGALAGYAVGRRRIVFADSVVAYQRRNAFQAILNDAGRDEPGPVPAIAPRLPSALIRPPSAFRHLR
jgi:excisionase family DNA binding protein